MLTPTDRSFSDLLPSETLLAGLTRMNISQPTPVQQEAIPAILSGRDVIAQGKTGSGKTLAFVLPLLTKLEILKPEGFTYGLIVTPTRELATQICEVIKSIDPQYDPPCLIGGMSGGGQRKALENDPRVVVGTPGRILDQLREGDLDLRKCGYFVLDEADEMLSMDFLEDITSILKKLPKDRQGCFISATITPRVESLARTFLREPKRIDVTTVAGEETPASIEHMYYEVGDEITSKVQALCDIIETQKPKSAIIFCNTKSETELVEVFLRRRGFDARRMNSDLNQRQRNFIMSKIRAQELRFLVGTDIAARGLDIEQIEMVVNYSIPDQSEVYVHRTGRTGRAGRSGRAVSLVGPSDFMAFLNLKRTATINLEKKELPGSDEINAARLEHLLEITAELSKDVRPADLVLAKSMLAGKSETEQIEQFSKLIRFTFEHYCAQNTKSLEDEMAEARGEEPQSQPRRQDDGDRRHRGHRDHRGSGRGRRDR